MSTPALPARGLDESGGWNVHSNCWRDSNVLACILLTILKTLSHYIPWDKNKGTVVPVHSTKAYKTAEV
jgi:hypothetical protein